MERLLRILIGFIAWVVVAAFVASFLMAADRAFLFILIGAASGAIVPFIICVTIAEIWSVRTKYYYMAFSLVPALAVAPRLNPKNSLVVPPSNGFALLLIVGMVVGGLVGSLAYWKIAGRHAGRAGKSGVDTRAASAAS